MLRPGPVKAAFTLIVFTLDLLALAVHRGQNLTQQVLVPARRGGENPIHLLVTADLHNSGLVTRGNNDGVVGRVIVNGVDVSPVAAGTSTGDITELIRFIHLGEVFSA